jgi:hypothetical protein
MSKAPRPDPTITLVHQGKTYTARYAVEGTQVCVYHHGASRCVPSDPWATTATMALQALHERVVRHGEGVPDEKA